MKEFIGLITVVLSFVGLVPYIVDIFRNKTKPHIFTWVVWALVTFLAFLAQWQKGGGPGSWTTGVTGLITIFIAIISLKKGSRDITTSDTIIFIFALLAIIPWWLMKDPTLSIVTLTIIDAIAFVPTFRKTIKDPESETLSSYVIHASRHSLSILALSTYNLATYIYPVVVALCNMIVIGIIVKYGTKNNAHNIIKREIYVVVHAQTTKFRLIKYLVLFSIMTIVYIFGGWLVAEKVLFYLLIFALSVHFLFRWKTEGWQKSWGPYKRLKNLP